MRCDRCDGSGLVRGEWAGFPASLPCQVCGGCGVTSCCEGATPCDEVVKEQAGDEASQP